MMMSVLDTVTASKMTKPALIPAAGLPKWAWLVVVLCGGIILWLTFKDISDPLLDRHSHRQTQTAISVHYMLSEGAWFPYITPVFGPPWSIPMEFPLYQWIVAGVVKVTGMPLELGGRLVSLFFWGLTLFELFRALRHFVPEQSKRAVLILLVAAGPASIYWSRSFMIETCALYLAVAFGGRVLSAVKDGKASAWLWAVCFGTLAALQKITTLFVAEALLGMILLVWLFLQRNVPEQRRHAMRHLGLFLLLGMWTLAVGLGWAAWTDGLKERNVMAREIITTKALKEWNYGTMQQRLTSATWQHLMSNVTLGFTGQTPGVGYKVPLLLWLAAALLTRRRLGQQGLLLTAFMAGPLVFMNLYHIHEYYFVANGYLLLLALGLAGVAAWEDKRVWVQRTALAFLGLVIVGQLSAYPRYHSLLIAEVPNRQQVETEFRQMLDARMGSAETLLVYGRDWDPSVAFYGQHKAIIDKFNWPLTDERMRELVGNLGPQERIGAMIVKGNMQTNTVFLQERFAAFGLEETPQASYWGDVYFRRQTGRSK
jgi:hypothetical protein